jgi:hypothetical protein
VANRGRQSILPIDSGIRDGRQSSTVQDVLPFQMAGDQSLGERTKRDDVAAFDDQTGSAQIS